MSRALKPLQVGTLLVSASYGIGFLFGSGELALQWGMAGSLYAVATAFGMLLLALVARRLWHIGLPVWDLFGRAFGPAASTGVALLSVVWMCGVLAAQIHGGVAVAQLMGLPPLAGQALVLALLLLASRLDLAVASRLFFATLATSTAILVVALGSSDGFGLYLHSLGAFTADLARVPDARLFVVVLAVTTLVVTGADYQQFVVAARSAPAAAAGCVIAAVVLLACGFLPAAVVISFLQLNPGDAAGAGHQIMPLIMARVVARFGGGFDLLLLLALLASALGSGAAIVRAMTGAVLAAAPAAARPREGLAGVVVVLAGALVASRGQAIVETMVSLNIVYIASVGLACAALYGGLRWTPASARAAMGAGFGASFVVYGAGWLGGGGDALDLVSLAAGLAASLLAVGALRLRRWRAGPGAALRSPAEPDAGAPRQRPAA